ncbi:hypothetical protein RFI_31004 [Reticulomyxa filosa]|uniref:PH domain-containing protein n=1 Tax=Reticulomyxa filosa TaxID=46433 RepID=X6LZ38_RETFI|nr:hypothetical protein RFI_31004 [Reticulomyxa filosa]|eukprot:ETO06392.1 hypothetical protein RFI_31004 [Reticulomyxa filosa]
MKQHMETECMNGSVPCPNRRCNQKIARKNASNHVSHECAYRLVECSYLKYGCTQELLIPAEMQRHEELNMSEHLNLRMDFLDRKNEEMLNDLKKQSDKINIKQHSRIIALERSKRRTKRKRASIAHALRQVQSDLQSHKNTLSHDIEALETKYNELKGLYMQLKISTKQHTLTPIISHDQIQTLTSAAMNSLDTGAEHKDVVVSTENSTNLTSDKESTILKADEKIKDYNSSGPELDIETDASVECETCKEDIQNKCKVVKQGYLEKQGHKFRTWRKRFFILMDDGSLIYHHNHKRLDRVIGQLNIASRC